MLSVSAFAPLYLLGIVYLSPMLFSCPPGLSGHLIMLSIAALLALFLLSVLCFIFVRTKLGYRGKWSGKVVEKSRLREGGALSFYTAILIPLITLCQMNSIGGFLCFWASLLISISLVFLDGAFVSNPVLLLAGLKTYEVVYTAYMTNVGEEGVEKEILCLTARRISSGDVISGRKIDDGKYFVF